MKWTKIIEEGDAIDVIYTDFSKAFDSVPHCRLLKKIESLGIQGNVLNWIKGFLSDRKQQVRVDGKSSRWREVMSGIPQGSVLGPSLFVIFINDLPDVVDSLCKLFADDVKVFQRVNIRRENHALQNDLEGLISWSSKWQLPFNTDKCECLNIGKNNPYVKYKMGGNELKQARFEKDLGVIIDRDLKFREQAATAIKKANSTLGIIKKAFACLDEVSLPLLYKSLVRPHLEYGNVIWGPFNKEDIISVEKIQRRATKMVKSMSHLDYGERLKNLNLPSLQHRRRRGDMIFAYNIFSKKVNIKYEDLFRLSSSRTRGHQYHLIRQQATKKCRANSFSNRIVSDWNTLPEEIVNATTTLNFKQKLDTHWKEEIYKYI